MFAWIFWIWMTAAIVLFFVGAIRADFLIALAGFILILLLTTFMIGAELATPHNIIEVT